MMNYLRMGAAPWCYEWDWTGQDGMGWTQYVEHGTDKVNEGIDMKTRDYVYEDQNMK